MTLAEFSNELRRLHCIGDGGLPGLEPLQHTQFLRNPVQFFLRADDAQQHAIWDAMVLDRMHWEVQIEERKKKESERRSQQRAERAP
jgi:hypothetical protein